MSVSAFFALSSAEMSFAILQGSSQAHYLGWTVCDQCPKYSTKQVNVDPNITLVLLPAKCPELNRRPWYYQVIVCMCADGDNVISVYFLLSYSITSK